jgi:hypothetical protein
VDSAKKVSDMVIKRSSNATVTSSIITEFKPSPEFEYPASSYQQHQQGIINDEDDFDNIFSVSFSLLPALH